MKAEKDKKPKKTDLFVLLLQLSASFYRIGLPHERVSLSGSFKKEDFLKVKKNYQYFLQLIAAI